MVFRDNHYSPVSYSRDGRLLACGTSTGMVLVYDSANMLLMRSRLLHSAPVNTICWSRGDSRLVSSGGDWRCIVWELHEKGSPHYSIDFWCPITCVRIHPRNKNVLLVSLSVTKPALVDLEVKEVVIIDNHEIATNEQSCIAHFDKTGRYIFTGSSKGQLCVLAVPVPISSLFNSQCGDEELVKSESPSNLKLLSTTEPSPAPQTNNATNAVNSSETVFAEKKNTQENHESEIIPHPRVLLPIVFEDTLCTSAVRHFALSRSGRHLAITLGDKTIRVYDLLHAGCPSNAPFECVPVFRLQDVVSRVPWISCAWSPCERYIAALTTGGSYSMQIWVRNTGYLYGILNAPHERAVDLAWHPTQPTIASTSSDGALIIWDTLPRPRWSAFAPGFRDIDSNIEYTERETEFDIDEEGEELVREAALKRVESIANYNFGEETDTETQVDIYTRLVDDSDSEGEMQHGTGYEEIDPARVLCVPLETEQVLHPEYFCQLAHPAMHYVRVQKEEFENKKRRRY